MQLYSTSSIYAEAAAQHTSCERRQEAAVATACDCYARARRREGGGVSRPAAEHSSSMRACHGRSERQRRARSHACIMYYLMQRLACMCARTMNKSQFCLNLEVGGRMRWLRQRLRAITASTFESSVSLSLSLQHCKILFSAVGVFIAPPPPFARRCWVAGQARPAVKLSEGQA